MASSSSLTTAQLQESRATSINVVAWVFTGVATATVFLKLFTRSQITKTLGWDDVFIFLALAFSIIAAAFVSYSVSLGLGRHTQAVLAEYGPDRLVKTAYWQILGYPFNIGSFSFPNISIAILIVNILNPNATRAILLYTMAGLQVVFALISVVLIFAQCTPTRMLWDPYTEGKCWRPSIFNDYNYFVSAYTTVTDIVLAFVPLSIFWKLQMPFSTKLGLSIMMGLTLLSAVVTIVKACYLKLFTDRTDPLYNVVPLVLWGLIEQNVVLVAACIPTLRPFFHKAVLRRRGWRSDGSSKPSASSSYKLSKLSAHHKGQSTSNWESALEEHQNMEGKAKVFDVESNNSQQGIWRRLEFNVSSGGEERESERGEVGKKPKDIIPPSLRT